MSKRVLLFPLLVVLFFQGGCFREPEKQPIIQDQGGSKINTSTTKQYYITGGIVSSHNPIDLP